MMKKAYLAVPLSFGRNLEFAKKIAESLKRLGCDITSPWVLDEDPSWGMTAEAIVKRDLRMIEESDLLVADISRPSIGVGMEIMYALSKGIKVVCVTKAGSPIPGLIAGNPKISLVILSDESELESKLRGVIVGERDRGETYEELGKGSRSRKC